MRGRARGLEGRGGWEVGQLRGACVAIKGRPPICIYIYAYRGLLREASACEVHDGGDETVTKQRDALALADLRLGEIGAR